jgi:hypothetical protein
MVNTLKIKRPYIKKLTLRFTRYAWAKIVHLNSLSTAEVGAFGISNAKNLLLVEDIAVIKQEVTGASVSFDDEAVADFFLDQVEAKRKPNQFARIWIHTHPNWFNPHIEKDDSIPAPSFTDEETFKRAFGNCDWSIMFIYGGGSSGYARLSIKKNLSGQIIIPVSKGNGELPTEADKREWEREFNENVTEIKPVVTIPFVNKFFGKPRLGTEEEKLSKMLDTDIDADEFAVFYQTFGHRVEDFYELDEASRQWWINEFRKDKNVPALRRIFNPYI